MMKCKILRGLRILLSVAVLAAAGSRNEGLSLMVQANQRRWRPPVARPDGWSIVPSAPLDRAAEQPHRPLTGLRTRPSLQGTALTIPRDCQPSGSENHVPHTLRRRSPRGSASYSNQVAARVIDELRQANPQATLTVRDLAQDPLSTSTPISSLRREARMDRARRNNALSLRNRMLWSTSCSPPTSSSSPRP